MCYERASTYRLVVTKIMTSNVLEHTLSIPHRVSTLKNIRFLRLCSVLPARLSAAQAVQVTKDTVLI